MAPQKILAELDSIIAYADGLKSMATRLRNKTASGIYGKPTPKGASKKALSPEQLASVLAGRRKTINRLKK